MVPSVQKIGIFLTHSALSAPSDEDPKGAQFRQGRLFIERQDIQPNPGRKFRQPSVYEGHQHPRVVAMERLSVA